MAEMVHISFITLRKGSETHGQTIKTRKTEKNRFCCVRAIRSLSSKKPVFFIFKSHFDYFNQFVPSLPFFYRKQTEGWVGFLNPDYDRCNSA